MVDRYAHGGFALAETLNVPVVSFDSGTLLDLQNPNILEHGPLTEEGVVCSVETVITLYHLTYPCRATRSCNKLEVLRGGSPSICTRRGLYKK